MIAFGIFFALLVSALIYALYIAVIAFTMWMVVDAGKQDRFLWVLLIVGVPVVGPLVYFFVQKKHEYMVMSTQHAHKNDGEEGPKHTEETK